MAKLVARIHVALKQAKDPSPLQVQVQREAGMLGWGRGQGRLCRTQVNSRFGALSHTDRRVKPGHPGLHAALPGALLYPL